MGNKRIIKLKYGIINEYVCKNHTQWINFNCNVMECCCNKFLFCSR